MPTTTGFVPSSCVMTIVVTPIVSTGGRCWPESRSHPK
jgi:hypothetical protein